MQSFPTGITNKAERSIYIHCDTMLEFVSDLQKVGDYLRFSSPIQLIAMILFKCC